MDILTFILNRHDKSNIYFQLAFINNFDDLLLLRTYSLST